MARPSPSHQVPTSTTAVAGLIKLPEQADAAVVYMALRRVLRYGLAGLQAE